MAASYDPIESSLDNPFGIRLPIDLETCEIKEDMWINWLAFDPLEILEQKHENLNSLDVLFIDCGNQDQYGIQYGSRKFVKRMIDLGVKHTWEEFDGTHSGIDYRLDISMPLLAKALSN